MFGVVMKKCDLIKALSVFPDSIEILVDGYESGYDDIVQPITPKKIRPKPNAPYYEGVYDDAGDTEKEAFNAVILKREMIDA